MKDITEQMSAQLMYTNALTKKHALEVLGSRYKERVLKVTMACSVALVIPTSTRGHGPAAKSVLPTTRLCYGQASD